MDIDRIIDDVAGADDQPKKTKLPFIDSGDDLSKIELKELLKHKYSDTEAGQREIYKRFHADVQELIKEYTKLLPDPKKNEGMYKCSLESWQYVLRQIGLNYFYDNKLLRDNEKIAAAGGMDFNDNLLEISINLYEDLCDQYHKQYFIYDCMRFLGLSNDCMYKLNELRNDILKKAHSKQEASMRTALASGRSNVTAMAILLNHDYDYTRTTQVIHTTSNNGITADKLPLLEGNKQIDMIPDNKTL